MSAPVCPDTGMSIEDCPFCQDEACNKCGAGCWDSSVTNCEHDVVERHEGPLTIGKMTKREKR